MAVADDAGRGGVVLEEDAVAEALDEGLGLGPVTPREDGDLAAGVLEGAGELLDDGSLAGAADGEVADGDDLHAEGGIAEDAGVVEDPAELHGPGEHVGEHLQGAAQRRGLLAGTLLEDDVEKVGLSVFEEFLPPFAHWGQLPVPGFQLPDWSSGGVGGARGKTAEVNSGL